MLVLLELAPDPMLVARSGGGRLSASAHAAALAATAAAADHPPLWADRRGAAAPILVPAPVAGDDLMGPPAAAWTMSQTAFKGGVAVLHAPASGVLMWREARLQAQVGMGCLYLCGTGQRE